MPTNNPAYMHEYYLKNKDRLRELLRQKVQCKVCNEMVSHWHLTRHQKSKKCMAKKSLKDLAIQ